MTQRKSLYGNTPPAMPELPLSRVAALQTAAQVTAQNLPVDRIDPNPFQARTTFENLEDLADAIRAQGFTSRLRVRPHPEQGGRFQLVYGERRLRAAKIAGVSMVPCEVVPHTDADMIEIGLAENIQREDLKPMEEARALRAVIDERGYSIRQLAERIGKKKGYIQNRLDLLRMPDDLQQMVEEHPQTFTAAGFLRNVPTAEAREPLIDEVVKGTLGKEAVRDVVQQMTSVTAFPTPRSPSQTSDTDTDQAIHAAPAMPTAAEGARAGQRPSHVPTPASPAEDRRRLRQSERVLNQAKQTLLAMHKQTQGFADELLPEHRDALLAFIVDEYFPRLEEVVEHLRRPS